MSVQIDMPNIRGIQNRLGEFANKAPRVLVNAINRTAKETRKEAKKIVKEKYTIAAKHANTYIKAPSKASLSRPSASLRISNRPQGLHKFKVTPKYQWNKVGRRRPKAYKSKILKSDPMQTPVRSMFVLETSRGPQVVFRKRGSSTSGRKKFVFMAGPSYARMIKDQDDGDRIKTFVRKELNDRVSEQIEKVLRRMAGRSST